MKSKHFQVPDDSTEPNCENHSKKLHTPVSTSNESEKHLIHRPATSSHTQKFYYNSFFSVSKYILIKLFSFLYTHNDFFLWGWKYGKINGKICLAKKKWVTICKFFQFASFSLSSFVSFLLLLKNNVIKMN